MKITKVKKIIIFGGGTSGWLAAAYLVKNLNFPCEIVLLESTKLGPIGVGEGTQPATARFLYDCGIDPIKWMKPSQAAFKLGVELVDWTEDNYFVDNDFIEKTQAGPDLYSVDYFVSRKKQEYFDWLPSYRLAKENKSPKLAGFDNHISQSTHRQFGAVHFSALDIVKSIREIIFDKIKYKDTEIVEIITDEDGIKFLKDKEGEIHAADLYVDCTGFAALLIGKHLGVGFRSINDVLPNDRAVAMPTFYNDPEKECHPYTKSTAMHSGWRWTIPIYSRIGNGYVYSSKFIDKENAEKELRESLGEFKNEARHLEMKCGIHEKIAYKNVIAVGLSAGFVEPLEATGITFTTMAVQSLAQVLNKNIGLWNNPSKNEINSFYLQSFWEIVSFVWAHYKFSNKKKTEYWNFVRSKDISDLPTEMQVILENFYPVLKGSLFQSSGSHFNVGHWFQVLAAGDLFNNIKTDLDPEVKKYLKYFVDDISKNTDLIIERFPNHYRFLKDWYGN